MKNLIQVCLVLFSTLSFGYETLHCDIRDLAESNQKVATYHFAPNEQTNINYFTSNEVVPGSNRSYSINLSFKVDNTQENVKLFCTGTIDGIYVLCPNVEFNNYFTQNIEHRTYRFILDCARKY